MVHPIANSIIYLSGDSEMASWVRPITSHVPASCKSVRSIQCRQSSLGQGACVTTQSAPTLL